MIRSVVLRLEVIFKPWFERFPWAPQAIKFALVGLFNTFVDLAIFSVLVFALDWAPVPAHCLSFGVGIISSYLLNRVWTFKEQKSLAQSLGQIWRFFLVQSGGLVWGAVTIFLLQYWLGGLGAKLVSLLVTFVWNFVLNKLLVFGQRPAAVVTNADWLARLTLLIYGIFVLVAFQDYGISWDEPVQQNYGKMLLAFYQSGFEDQRAFSYINLYYYGGLDWIFAGIQQISPFDIWQTRHLLGGWIALFGLYLTWQLAKKWGGVICGLVAILLMATLPVYVGHGFINPKDLPLAVAMTALLAAICWCLSQWPKPNGLSVLFLGVSLGVTLGIRIGGGIAFFYLAIPVLFVFGRDWRLGFGANAKNFLTFVIRLVPALPLAYLVMVFLWPWAALSWDNPLDALVMFGQFPFRHDMLFEGRLVRTDDLPGNYLFEFLLVTLPPMWLIGISLLPIVWFLRLRQRKALLVVDNEALVWLAITMAVIVPLAYFWLARPVAYNGLRHFLFLLPPLAVLIAWAYATCFRWASSRTEMPLIVAFVVGLFLPIYDMARLHPYTYVYFNSLTGGLKGAHQRFELDYWATSMRESLELLNAQLKSRGLDQPEKPWKLWVCAEPGVVSPYLPDTFLVVHDRAEADFGLALEAVYCAPPQGSVQWAVVERMGVPLNRVYDLRPSRQISQ